MLKLPKPIIKEIDFDMYNDTCSDCIKHDECHTNNEIDYDAVEKCVKEIHDEFKRVDALERQHNRKLY